MKFQNPEWRFASPGPLSDKAVSHFHSLAKRTAAQGRVQDILEDFKARFSDGSSSRSSSASWAESDLMSLMRAAAENAPVFIEAFVNACSDLREQGHDAPGTKAINDGLYQSDAGYQIADDTVVAVRGLIAHESVGPSAPETASVVSAKPVTTGVDSHRVVDSPAPAGLPAVAFSNQLDTIRLMVGPRPQKQQPNPMLQVFICHSSGDKPAARDLYARLKGDGYQPWLDEENLLPGQDWESEIRKAVKNSHVVVVCLSKGSVTKTGFGQKEIKVALDVADEQPANTIFIIPARLEDCDVPERLRKWHWVDLFETMGYTKLLASLAHRASSLK
jgi:hypothetical protein